MVYFKYKLLQYGKKYGVYLKVKYYNVVKIIGCVLRKKNYMV